LTSRHFVCGTCGQTHAGLPADHGFKLPDAVWAIPEPERSSRARHTADLCRLDQRRFIRGVLPVPLQGAGDSFGWGVWAEVERATFDRYIELFDQDGSGEPAHAAILANAIPVYEGSIGTPVLLQFQDRQTRPTIHLMPEDRSRLAQEQRQGIDSARHHEIVDRLSTPRPR
jgi:hypothetical protein